MLNLDTHILIRAFADDLKPSERQLLRKETWGISAIVFWEITKLVQLKKIELDLEDPEFIRALSKLHVWPLDWAVCQALNQLDFKSDPADELIAATSIVHHVPLVTRDGVIKKSKIVPLAF